MERRSSVPATGETNDDQGGVVARSRIILLITALSVIGGVAVIAVDNSDEDYEALRARFELKVMMFSIERGLIDLKKMNDKEYVSTCIKFASLINEIGEVDSAREHYFRTHFTRAPETLNEMVKIILNDKNDVFEWELLPWEKTAFHMYGKDGEYNLKFLSADGHFEAVYNKQGILLTPRNDP